ncbi:MAG: DUF222 domain-containing protein [Nocardioidaceae bacterium]|nr:DUF222 domain-containing protein [Nocardioidaceae bacterium]
MSFVGEFESLLTGVSDAPAWTLTASELTDLLPRLARAANQVASVQLRMLREADRHQVGDPVGAANTAGWWANQTRTTKPAAYRQVPLASRLDDDAHAAVSGALAAGSVNIEQTAVIVNAVEALPSELVSASLRRMPRRSTPPPPRRSRCARTATAPTSGGSRSPSSPARSGTGCPGP